MTGVQTCALPISRRNVERKGRVGELGYEASKMSSGSPERSGTGRDEEFTLKGIAALTTHTNCQAYALNTLKRWSQCGHFSGSRESTPAPRSEISRRSALPSTTVHSSPCSEFQPRWMIHGLPTLISSGGSPPIGTCRDHFATSPQSDTPRPRSRSTFQSLSLCQENAFVTVHIGGSYQYQ